MGFSAHQIVSGREKLPGLEGKQWALLAALSGLVVAKNPPLQEWLGKLLEGVNAGMLQHAQPREAEQQPALLAERPLIEIPVFKPFQFEHPVTPLPHTLPHWTNP